MSQTASPISTLDVAAGTVTCESVTAGHPDKVADRLSDAVLDACLAQDPASRVACETLVTTERVVLAGEITSHARLDLEDLARATLRDLGYDRESEGFAADTVDVDVLIHPQEPEIGGGVDRGGAGDQGLMIGFACDETPERLPLPLALARRLTDRLTELRRSTPDGWLRPDGKSQVSVRYRDGRPAAVTAVVLSSQHVPEVSLAEARRRLVTEILDPVVPAELRAADLALHLNPAGAFTRGGPATDTGLTGRKIVVDTYGGVAPHGGGAFSGKDATKVDRSAAYMARLAARVLVDAGLARRALVQVAYAIGVADPVALLVDTRGTGAVADETLAAALREVLPFDPRGIIERLGLRRPIFADTASNGHFGRADLPWEDTAAAVDALRSRLG